MTQPDQMTPADANERPTTPDVPPVPGADVDPDQLEAGSDQQPGAPSPQDDGAEHADESSDPADTVTSPRLEHLDDTIKKARAAADEALSDQPKQSE